MSTYGGVITNKSCFGAFVERVSESLKIKGCRKHLCFESTSVDIIVVLTFFSNLFKEKRGHQIVYLDYSNVSPMKKVW